ncbi:hypothetical protein CRUP_023147 [Coryphaenoides rupestris]|nr:hypothetical protein CRUP_023147 [Coryphaenoides rupestris]
MAGAVTLSPYRCGAPHSSCCRSTRGAPARGLPGASPYIACRAREHLGRSGRGRGLGSAGHAGWWWEQSRRREEPDSPSSEPLRYRSGSFRVGELVRGPAAIKVSFLQDNMNMNVKTGGHGNGGGDDEDEDEDGEAVDMEEYEESGLLETDEVNDITNHHQP